MRKLFKERKLFKGGNYMRKYGIWNSFGKIDYSAIHTQGSFLLLNSIGEPYMV